MERHKLQTPTIKSTKTNEYHIRLFVYGHPHPSTTRWLQINCKKTNKNISNHLCCKSMLNVLIHHSSMCNFYRSWCDWEVTCERITHTYQLILFRWLEIICMKCSSAFLVDMCTLPPLEKDSLWRLIILTLKASGD